MGKCKIKGKFIYLFIYLLLINSTRIQKKQKTKNKKQTNKKKKIIIIIIDYIKINENCREKMWRRRQPKVLMRHTRDALSN